MLLIGVKRKSLQTRDSGTLVVAGIPCLLLGLRQGSMGAAVTSGHSGVSNSYKVEKLNQLIRGWINYFKIGSMKKLCKQHDGTIRYRLCMCIWKHWKTPQKREKNLIKLGVPKWATKRTLYAKGYARVCRGSDICQAINNKRLTSFGLVSMLDYYTERCVTC